MQNVFFSTSKFAAVICAAGGVLVASGATAYTPKWLECDGQMVTTTTVDGKPQSTSAPAHDFYVYDDDSKNLYKHSDARKTEDVEPVQSYTDKEIKWASKGSGASEANWEGMLNRSSLALTINYKDKGSTIVWTQQCKPSSPKS
jgi:hypothetical protein